LVHDVDAAFLHYDGQQNKKYNGKPEHTPSGDDFAAWFRRLTAHKKAGFIL
jgi:hypothetical protein